MMEHGRSHDIKWIGKAHPHTHTHTDTSEAGQIPPTTLCRLCHSVVPLVPQHQSACEIMSFAGEGHWAHSELIACSGRIAVTDQE